MKMKPHHRSILLASLLSPLLVFAQDATEEEDVDLLKQAMELLEEAKLSDVLDERRILQDLELDELPDKETIIREAKEHLKELQLQAQGVITQDALDQVADVVNEEPREEKASSTDVLGAPPEKAIKISPPEENDMITIENSEKFAGSAEDGILVFQGDVLAGISSDLTMRCDKLEVHLDEAQKEAKLAIATGRMVVIEGSSEKGPVEARCQYAVYKGDVMYLRLWPEVSMSGRLLKAQDKDAYIKLVVDENKNLDYEIFGHITTSIRKPEEEAEP